MNRRALATGMVIGALTLAGCATQGLLRQADAHLARNDPGMAVYFFSEALKRRPKLAQDPEFIVRYRDARFRAAMHEGRLAAKVGDWETAVTCFERAVEIEPTDATAAAALSSARGDAAVRAYKRAVQAADDGDGETARSLLEKARKYDATNRDVTDALRFSHSGRLPEGEPSTLRYAEAVDRSREKRWGEARTILTEVIEDNPRHILARVRCHDVDANLAEARGLHEQGGRELDGKRLRRAEQRFTAALDVWPFFREATASLREVQKRIAQVEKHLAEARRLAGTEQWNEALEEIASASALDADRTEAHVLRGEVRGRAAAAYHRTGQALFKQGKLAEAEREFEACFQYVPRMEDARRGLGAVAGHRADEYVNQKLWGNALVWYWKAWDRFPEKRYQKGTAAMTQRIAARLDTTVDVVVGAPDVQRSDAETFSDGVRKGLGGKRPAFIAMRFIGKPDGDAALVASLVLRFCEVEHDVTSRANKTHPFTEYHEEPNPKLDKLAHEIRIVQARLHRLRHDYHRECRHCRGRGTVVCSRCRGGGPEVCTACRGSGTVEAEEERHVCETCRGRGRLVCGHCDGQRVRCSRCRGSGRDSRVALSDIHMREHELRRLEREFRHEPETIMVGYPAHWAYTEVSHLKSGRGRVSLGLADRAGGALFQDTFETTVEHRDRTVENPNPEIGLEADPLQLPRDRDVREHVLSKLAADSADAVIRETLKALGKSVSAEAARAEGDARIESLAERYLLLLHLDGSEAKRAREALMQMVR